VKSVTKTVKIRVAIATREALKEFGRKGSTYDSIIMYLIRFNDVAAKIDPTLYDRVTQRMQEEVKG